MTFVLQEMADRAIMSTSSRARARAAASAGGRGGARGWSPPRFPPGSPEKDASRSAIMWDAPCFSATQMRSFQWRYASSGMSRRSRYLASAPTRAKPLRS